MKKLLPFLALALAAAAVLATPALARKHHTFVVCKHGCKYRKIQSAVNAARAGDTVRIKPGKYVEGVIVRGHKRNGLKIVGAAKNPRRVILEGKNAKGPYGAAQNGVEGDTVNNLTVENVWARNYPANGIFVHDCRGYLFRNDVVSHNVAYGLYAFKCVGGRMTRDVGYLHADSAWYVGGTPYQKHPVWTQIDHMTAYRNVLGYSGTNSHYVRIHDSEFFNNGAGIVPNTLDSEPNQPASENRFDHNLVYWNNFDYWKKGSGIPVRHQSTQGAGTNYPFGIGVILFGTTHSVVTQNKIFGNRMYGVAMFGNPLVEKFPKTVAESYRNVIAKNALGAGGKDINRVDLFSAGDGYGNCFDQPGATLEHSATRSDALLYPACPNPSTTNLNYDPDNTQKMVKYAYQTTGEEDSWAPHWHHAHRKGRTPVDGYSG